MKKNRILILQVAALGWDLVHEHDARVEGLTWHAAESVFPAVTCTAQAGLRTGLPASQHGMVCNGRYLRELARVMFWEQSARLVSGPRIWEAAQAAGHRVGMMFWQQSLGEAADVILSPKPVHKHSGGMIQDCYGRPEALYPELIQEIGRPFNLMHYWGPLASRGSSDWIAEALCAVMRDAEWAPDVLFGYLPHLDYDLQKRGPGDPAIAGTVAVAMAQVNRVVQAAREAGYQVVVAGDYAIGPVTAAAVYLNRLLREHGWLRCQTVKGRAYPDFYGSAAFAMVDHEVAHVYVQDPAVLPAVREAVAALEGVGTVLEGTGKREAGIDHPNAGELVLVAAPGAWFAYPWWRASREAPDFATHIDIHNKPGFDPCELFWGWPPPRISQDTAKVRGTHGRAGPDRHIAWATTCEFAEQPVSLLNLADQIQDWLARTG